MEWLWDLFIGLLRNVDKLSPEARDPVITLTAIYMANQVRRIRKEFTAQAAKVAESIDALNRNVAIVIERVDSHEVRLTAVEQAAKPSP